MDHKGKAWKAENGVRKTTKENFPKTNKFQKGILMLLIALRWGHKTKKTLLVFFNQKLQTLKQIMIRNTPYDAPTF